MNDHLDDYPGVYTLSGVDAPAVPDDDRAPAPPPAPPPAPAARVDNAWPQDWAPKEVASARPPEHLTRHDVDPLTRRCRHCGLDDLALAAFDRPSGVCPAAAAAPAILALRRQQQAERTNELFRKAVEAEDRERRRQVAVVDADGRVRVVGTGMFPRPLGWSDPAECEQHRVDPYTRRCVLCGSHEVDILSDGEPMTVAALPAAATLPEVITVRSPYNGNGRASLGTPLVVSVDTSPPPPTAAAPPPPAAPPGPRKPGRRAVTLPED